MNVQSEKFRLIEWLVSLNDDWVNKTFTEFRNQWKYGDKLVPEIADVIKDYTTDGKMDWKAAFDNIWKTSKTFDKVK